MTDVLTALGRYAQSDAIAFEDDKTTLSYAELARRVAGAAQVLTNLPRTVGLLGASSIDWLVVDLAAWMSGTRLVPLPHFFSDAQLAHIIADAGITKIVTAPDQVERVRGLGATPCEMPRAEMSWRPGEMAGERVVYTSGSTGAPKGVILEAAQIQASCQALIEASAATSDDRHLSVLPFSLLLEAICGIYLPVLAGGRCRVAADVVAAQGIDIAIRLGEAAEQAQPTTMVLVPQLLQAWTMAAAVGRVTVPVGLRFVAVGGAAIPEPIAARAWELGIPVHEGYGLTECCSVVAVNRPGQRRAGSVGHPLPGCQVSIAADGEIVVRGAAVAAGYLGRSDGPCGGVWQTGDLGSIDDDGYLRVSGRKDNLIVTANGRNIAPEWIETMLLADPRIARCVLTTNGSGELCLLLEASLLGAGWLMAADARRLNNLVSGLLHGAPAYAMPRHIVAMAPDGLAIAGLLTGNGRPRRREIAARHAEIFPHQTDSQTEIHHAVL